MYNLDRKHLRVSLNLLASSVAAGDSYYRVRP